jgi:hypothetical protein
MAILIPAVSLLIAATVVREFDVSIRERRVEGSESTLRVQRGDTIVLHWRSDERVSLHIHGYDLQVEVAPGSPATTRFEAAIAGRFPVAAHAFGGAAGTAGRPASHREVTLLYLEVLPE